MEKLLTSLCFTSCILVISICTASAKDCNSDEVGLVMMSCHDERKALSQSTAQNDTSLLCGALQKYAECIGPKVSDCKGQDLLAFNIIKTKYSAAPFHCRVTETWMDNKGNEYNFPNGDDDGGFNDDEDENHVVSHPPLEGLDATVALQPVVNKKKSLPAKSSTTQLEPTTPGSSPDAKAKDSNNSSSNKSGTSDASSCRQTHLNTVAFTSVLLSIFMCNLLGSMLPL